MPPFFIRSFWSNDAGRPSCNGICCRQHSVTRVDKTTPRMCSDSPSRRALGSTAKLRDQLSYRQKNRRPGRPRRRRRGSQPCQKALRLRPSARARSREHCSAGTSSRPGPRSRTSGPPSSMSTGRPTSRSYRYGRVTSAHGLAHAHAVAVAGRRSIQEHRPVSFEITTFEGTPAHARWSPGDKA